MRAARAALAQGTGTRAEWTQASVDYYLAFHPDEATWLPSGADDEIPSVDEIRDRAAIADRAGKAVPHDGRVDPDPEHRDEWSARLAWFDVTWTAVFTDRFLAAVAALQAGDRSELEYGVRFLEADPWCFRSGYTKARLLPAIARLKLDESIRQRLARVVLAAVDDTRRRKEIRKYGSVARAVGSGELRAQLELRTVAADPQVRFNARQILKRLDGN
jgi:hypothetical protein